MLVGSNRLHVKAKNNLWEKKIVSSLPRSYAVITTGVHWWGTSHFPKSLVHRSPIHIQLFDSTFLSCSENGWLFDLDDWLYYRDDHPLLEGVVKTLAFFLWGCRYWRVAAVSRWKVVRIWLRKVCFPFICWSCFLKAVLIWNKFGVCLFAFQPATIVRTWEDSAFVFTYIYILYTLEVQPPFLIGRFTNHQ